MHQTREYIVVFATIGGAGLSPHTKGLSTITV